MNPQPTPARPNNPQENPGRCGDDRGAMPLHALIDAYSAAINAGFVHTAAAFASLIRNHPERTRA